MTISSITSSECTLTIVSLVDDGTEVIAVHHTYKDQCVTANAHYRPALETRSSIKGKEKAKDDYQYNIPSQYQLPPLPALPRATKRATKTLSPPIDPAKAFEIGDLLSITGRIEVWRWGGERIVCVDKVVPGDIIKSDHTNAEGGNIVTTASDLNEEPIHLLLALRLSATEYSRPFKIPQAMSHPTSTWTPQHLRELTNKDVSNSSPAPKRSALRVMEDTSPRAPQKKALRVMEDISEDNGHTVRKRTLGVPHRKVQSIGETDSNSYIEMKAKVGQEKPSRTQEISVTQVESLPMSQVSITSVQTTGSPRHRRQLRKYTKLSDSSLTESTFRVYVEKHIVDFCSGEASLGTLSQLLRTPTSTRKRRSRASSGEVLPEPPAFTLKYLLMIEDLYEHARRTVEVASKKREEKRRRKAALSGSSITPIASREKISDKVKRLYSSVLQAMMMDGIIVLASPSVAIRPPFDGKVKTTKSTDVIVLSSSDTEREAYTKGYSRRDADAYQIVTPLLLALPIHQITSYAANVNLDSAQIVKKLQMMDERWHYIREESVQECIPILQKAAAQ